MSLIHTCRLAGTNPLAYINWLLKNAREIEKSPKTACRGIIRKVDPIVRGTPAMPAGSPIYHSNLLVRGVFFSSVHANRKNTVLLRLITPHGER